jgi:hypothetical protein
MKTVDDNLVGCDNDMVVMLENVSR